VYQIVYQIGSNSIRLFFSTYLTVCQRNTRTWVMPQLLNFKKGQQYETTLLFSHYLSLIGPQQIKQRNQCMFETFSRNKKRCSSRDEKAFQILAVFSHATYVSKVGINMKFEKYSSIYPNRGFSPNSQCFQGRPQYFPPFPLNRVSSWDGCWSCFELT
jgi:hypothetical protein